jgi:ribosomal protein S19
MKHTAILLLAFTLCVGPARSQNVTNNKAIVINSALTGATNDGTNLPFFTTAADAEKIVSSIMSAMGLESNFKIKEANVPNVEAKIRHHERYILYNPAFVKQVNVATGNKWASIFILAHEVGHHLEGHTLMDISSRPSIELEADEFAGFALHKMGASLQQSQLAMYYISNSEASKSHPARADRLAAIEKGWDKEDGQTAGITPGLNGMQTNSQNN